MAENWYHIDNIQSVISPSLFVFPDRIQSNIRRMIKIAGAPEKLRPHIKTHKIAELIEMQLAEGIDKFKCATIAEAELLATCEAPDILLAMQPVGINIQRFFALIKSYPNSIFSTIIDNSTSLNEIIAIARKNNIIVDLWIDINNGMNRTGIAPGKKAIELYQLSSENKNVRPRGLHVYDGHVHDTDFKKRKDRCEKDFYSVSQLKNEIILRGWKVDKIVAGGTPTFPIHVKREDVEVSPGTPLLWDEGYASKYPDLNFLNAALIFSRVVSKPSFDLICLDLGHKSVASEMSLPRVTFLNHKGCDHISQSEEHLVLSCDEKNELNIGDAFFAIPVHICPTISKYPEVFPVVEGKIGRAWSVAARDHKILI